MEGLIFLPTGMLSLTFLHESNGHFAQKEINSRRFSGYSGFQ